MFTSFDHSLPIRYTCLNEVGFGHASNNNIPNECCPREKGFYDGNLWLWFLPRAPSTIYRQLKLKIGVWNFRIFNFTAQKVWRRTFLACLLKKKIVVIESYSSTIYAFRKNEKKMQTTIVAMNLTMYESKVCKNVCLCDKIILCYYLLIRGC